jgi:hypothetical protein
VYIKGESGRGRDDETRKKFGDEGGMREKEKSTSVRRESPRPQSLMGHVKIRVPVPSNLEVTVILVTSRLLWYDSRLFA